MRAPRLRKGPLHTLVADEDTFLSPSAGLAHACCFQVASHGKGPVPILCPPRCPADSPWQLLRFQRRYRTSLQVSRPARAPRQRPFETSPGSGLRACRRSQRPHNGRATQRATPRPPRLRTIPRGGRRARRAQRPASPPPAGLAPSPASPPPRSPTRPSLALPHSPSPRTDPPRPPRSAFPDPPPPMAPPTPNVPASSRPPPGPALCPFKAHPAPLPPRPNSVPTGLKPRAGAGPTLSGSPAPPPRACRPGA